LIPFERILGLTTLVNISCSVASKQSGTKSCTVPATQIYGSNLVDIY